jgi:hypothetical protein
VSPGCEKIRFYEPCFPQPRRYRKSVLEDFLILQEETLRLAAWDEFKEMKEKLEKIPEVERKANLIDKMRCRRCGGKLDNFMDSCSSCNCRCHQYMVRHIHFPCPVCSSQHSESELKKKKKDELIQLILRG